VAVASSQLGNACGTGPGVLIIKRLRSQVTVHSMAHPTIFERAAGRCPVPPFGVVLFPNSATGVLNEPGRPSMKYMILAYGSQRDYDALAANEGAQLATSAEELAEIGEFLAKFTGDLAAAGELVDAQGLTAPVLARRVHLREGVPVVTDGPFAETEEVIAGYWIVDCVSFDRATEIAARLNQAPGRPAGAGVVIRPVSEPETDDI
jgi:hypothetical protein